WTPSGCRQNAARKYRINLLTSQGIPARKSEELRPKRWNTSRSFFPPSSPLVLRDDHLVRTGIPHGLGVPLLACPGDDPQVGVHRFGRHSDIKVVRIVVDQDADSPRPVNPRRQQCVVSLRVSMDDRDTILEQLVVQPFVRFDEDKGYVQAIELIDDGSPAVTRGNFTRGAIRWRLAC
ncbi:MAG: hypothetical protein NUW14_12535, partial [Deltaproteobacteria bacterium]|nr:hypothetical protein [Deltaproteobacteria bacterium]